MSHVVFEAMDVRYGRNLSAGRLGIVVIFSETIMSDPWMHCVKELDIVSIVVGVLCRNVALDDGNEVVICPVGTGLVRGTDLRPGDKALPDFACKRRTKEQRQGDPEI